VELKVFPKGHKTKQEYKNYAERQTGENKEKKKD
jgi:hypothetical protein